MEDSRGRGRLLLFLRQLEEPKTKDEIIEELSGTVSREDVEKSVQELAENGDMVCKCLSEGSTLLYWRPTKSDLQANKTPGGRLRQHSTRSRLSFKSPAKLVSSSSSEAMCRDTSSNLESLAKEILQLRKQLEAANREIVELSTDYHEDELQDHIERLHQYNEIKDVGQMLLGKIAEVEGTTTAAVHERFGLNIDD